MRVETVDTETDEQPKPKHITFFGVCSWCCDVVAAHESGMYPLQHSCKPRGELARMDFWRRPHQEVWGPLDTNVARDRRRIAKAHALPDSDAELQAEFEKLERQLLRVEVRLQRVRAEIDRRKASPCA